MNNTVADKIKMMDVRKMVDAQASHEAQEIFDKHNDANHVVFIIRGPDWENGAALKIYRNQCWEIIDLDIVRKEIERDIRRGMWMFDQAFNPMDLFDDDLNDDDEDDYPY